MDAGELRPARLALEKSSEAGNKAEANRDFPAIRQAMAAVVMVMKSHLEKGEAAPAAPVPASVLSK